MVDVSRLFSGGKARHHDKALQHAAQVAVRDVLAVGTRDRVVIVTTPDQGVRSIAAALHDAAASTGAETLLMVQAPKGDRDLADPGVLRVLETDPDVVINAMHGRLGADPERIHRPIHGTYTHYLQYLIGEGRSRGFWTHVQDPKVFARGVPIDLAALGKEADALTALLADTVELRVVGERGTDLVFPLDGAKAVAEAGALQTPGAASLLPTGTVRVPLLAEAQAEGRIVVDGTLGLPDGGGAVREPVVMEVEDGRVTRIEGGANGRAVQAALAGSEQAAERAVAGGWLTRDQSKVYANNARVVSELSIGLNPSLKMCGDPTVDGRARGAVQVRVGAPTDVHPPRAPVAVDAILKRATIVAVMEDGTEVPLVSDGALRADVVVPSLA